MAHIIRIAKLTDRQIIKLINSFADDLDGEVRSISVSGVVVPFESDAIKSLEKAKDISAITSFDLLVGNPKAVVKFRRGIGGTIDNMDGPGRIASPYFDEIEVDYPRSHSSQPQPNVDVVLHARRIISSHTKLPDNKELTGHYSEAADLLKLQFSQLNEQLLEINTAAMVRRQELEDEYAEKRRHIEDDIDRHAEQVRQKTTELEEEFKLRSEAIEARERQLDDRDHIHARRELRTHMTDAIATQLQGSLVPRNASRMRWSIFGMLIAGAFILAGLSTWSLYEFGRIVYLASLMSGEAVDNASRNYALAQVDRGFHWLILARGFIAGAVSIGFLLYAISWLKGVYHDEVRTRRELQRYATDLNRASWAIETIMEAKSSGDVVIPDAVIAGVTRNLFEAQGLQKQASETSANALAELLRTSGSARFGPNGAEFELSNRGANRLADKIDT